MEKVFDLTLSPKQGEAFKILMTPLELLELMMGGAKGGGKSVFGCKWVFYYVKFLMQFFDLKPSDNPPVLGFIGRKQAVDFSTTTLNTWKREIPSDAYEIKEQKKLIIIEGCAAIQYGGLDDSDTVKKFNSAEYAFIWLDQPDECTQQDVGMLRATLRFKWDGKQPPYKFLFTPNPVISDDPQLQYLREEFIESPASHRKFLKVLYTDNPFLPKNYGDTLDDAFKFNPALLKAYKEGDWEQQGIANVVIPRASAVKCINNPFPWVDQFVRKITVCDVAGEGGDEAVIYDMENATIKNQEIYSHRDLMDTVGRVIAHGKKNDSSVLVIDKVGEGAGVWSRIKEIYRDDISSGKIIVYGFDGRLGAPDGWNDETYSNYKTFAWFKASKEYFAEGRANIPDDKILIQQLTAVKWEYHSNGKIILEDKKKIKESLGGRSPDRADAYVMGLDGLQYAKTKVKTDDQAKEWKGQSFVPDFWEKRYADVA